MASQQGWKKCADTADMSLGKTPKKRKIRKIKKET